MKELLDYVLNIPPSSWYHALAFVLTGAAAQYSVQLVKVLGKNKYSKWFLRTLNGTFNTLYVAAAAIATGGIALGEDVKTILALTTVSTVIYRIHNSFLYTSAEKVLDDSGVLKDSSTGKPVAIVTSPDQFAAN